MFLKKKLFGLLVCTAPLVSLTSYGAEKGAPHQEQVPQEQTQQQQQQQAPVDPLAKEYARIKAECEAIEGRDCTQVDTDAQVHARCDVVRHTPSINTRPVSFPGEGLQSVHWGVKGIDHSCYDGYGIEAPGYNTTCQIGSVLVERAKTPISFPVKCADLTPERLANLCSAEFEKRCAPASAQDQAQAQGPAQCPDTCEREVVEVDTCKYYENR